MQLVAILVCLFTFCVIVVRAVPLQSPQFLESTRTRPHGKHGAGDGNLTTNAERLARGLTPLKPKRLFNPARTRPLAARASGGATSTTGAIALRYPGNTDVICWMTDSICLTDASDAWTWSAIIGDGPQTLVNLDVQDFNLYLKSEGFPTPPLTQAEFDDNLGGGTISNGEAYTAPFAGPVDDYYETSVWYLDQSGLMTAEWFDPSTGDQIPLSVLYDPGAGGPNIFLTNDPTNYAYYYYYDNGAYDGDTLQDALLYFYTPPPNN